MTAVTAEADAVLRGVTGPEGPESVLPGGAVLRRRGRVDVLAAGAGPAAAAAGTAIALAAAGPAAYGLVVSAGIAGGFAPHAPLGGAVVAAELVAADLGAESPEGFLDLAELGFGRSRHPAADPEAIAAALRAAGLPVAVGPVLTVSTATGTGPSAAELLRRHPAAVAEAMEGFGVAEAAARFGLPVQELRTVSNAVGPRDRAAWRIGDALAALERVFAALPYEALLGPVKEAAL